LSSLLDHTPERATEEAHSHRSPNAGSEEIRGLVGDDEEGLRDYVQKFAGDDAMLDYFLGRPIFLEKGDGRWRITRLDWYFDGLP
jgi:hypothetical protein